MKKFIAAVLLLATMSTLLCGCSSYEDWHNRQIDKGMAEAREILGR